METNAFFFISFIGIHSYIGIIQTQFALILHRPTPVAPFS